MNIPTPILGQFSNVYSTICRTLILYVSRRTAHEQLRNVIDAQLKGTAWVGDSIIMSEYIVTLGVSPELLSLLILHNHSIGDRQWRIDLVFH